jgi:hypothetical protein
MEAIQRVEAVALNFALGVSTRSELSLRVRAANEFLRWVIRAIGVEAVQMGVHLRKTRRLMLVLQLLYEADGGLQNAGLAILANLVSDAFDPASDRTKKQVLSAGVFHRLRGFVYTDDGVACASACACLQNLCKQFAFAKLACRYELHEELDRLVRESGSEDVREHAAGTLHNMSEAIARHARLYSLDPLEARRAALEAGFEGAPRIGLFRKLFLCEQEPDFTISDEVARELAARFVGYEQLQLTEVAAAIKLQTFARRFKLRRAFMRYQQLSRAVKVVSCFVWRWLRKRRHLAAVRIQEHARAYLHASRSRCDRRTLILVMRTLRRARQRAHARSVRERAAWSQLHHERSDAAKALAERHAGAAEAASGGGSGGKDMLRQLSHLRVSGAAPERVLPQLPNLRRFPVRGVPLGELG